MHTETLAVVYAYTAIGVGIMLALASFASALGWGLIGSKYIEGLARQPELRTLLAGQVMIMGGLMESFPMIALGISMWFVLANPFVSALTRS